MSNRVGQNTEGYSLIVMEAGRSKPKSRQGRAGKGLLPGLFLAPGGFPAMIVTPRLADAKSFPRLCRHHFFSSLSLFSHDLSYKDTSHIGLGLG